MTNILWIIALIFVSLWILGLVLTLLGFLVHIALILFKYALIVALIVAGLNLILGKIRR